MTSYHLAKSLALSKNRMILAVWEDSANYSYPVYLKDDNGKIYIGDLFEDKIVKELIWQHFVPVIIREAKYDELAEDLKGKSFKYTERFNDDFLKVMDPNGKILNVATQEIFNGENISSIIKKYALNTSFLKPELDNYFENKNFSTTFRLANKYLNATIYLNDLLKKEMINLSEIYMSEARTILDNDNLDNKEALKQKIDLLQIKKILILGKPRKASRLLKKYKKDDIGDINLSLYAFLKYTTNRYLKDIDEALVWKDQVLERDLKKVQYIIK